METTDQSRTAAYYAQHAQEYFERTNFLGMGSVRKPFASRLRPGSRILDLGCGSGRDARHFATLGHTVVALDPCRELLNLARENTPHDLRELIAYVCGQAPCLDFDDDFFDAIWACGSLLHLHRDEMFPAMMECRRVLRPSGLLFLALKTRDQNDESDDRAFTLWSADQLRQVVAKTPFEVLTMGEVDSLHGRAATWLNVLLQNA